MNSSGLRQDPIVHPHKNGYPSHLIMLSSLRRIALGYCEEC